jgi:peptidoglycan hydrolase-like protein with peptidoglycan-binding domain
MAAHLLALAAAASGLGYLGYREYQKHQVQIHHMIGAGGVPVRVITPIGPVSPGQLHGIPSPAASGSASAVITSDGTVYAPPKLLDGGQASPIIATPTGSSSLAIGTLLDIQRALNTLGIKPAVTEDGKMGPKTVAAVKAFQRTAGLVVDGSAGPATKAALSNALTALIAGGVSAPIPSAASLAVAQGHPAVVKTLLDIQHGLNLLGASPTLPEDGKSGPKTVAAIKSFQLTHGLAPDGIAGAKTKAAIGIALGVTA